MTNFINDNKKSLDRLKWVFKQLKIESPYGIIALSEIKPFKSNDEKHLRQSFEILSHIISILEEKPDLFQSFNRYFMELRNISGSLNNLNNNQTLNETELFEIKNFAIIVCDILELADKNKITLKKLSNSSLNQIIILLNPDKIITRSFYIHESWSDNLKEIREHKKLIEAKIVLEKDNQIKEQLRNERALIVYQERDEELSVRKKLTIELKKYQNELETIVNNIGLFELLLAKAELAIENKCCIPEIYEANSEKKITIENAIEPEIAENLKANNRKFVPVSIQLQKGVTILTGANMGGKSVALKTIALNAELARFGFCPFADKFSFIIPDFIDIIAGDLQNSDNGLSSFGAEIIELTELLKKLDDKTGIAICDELGRSTNPYEGSRFVKALSERLQLSSSYGIIATHYDGINTDGAVFYQVAGLKALFQRDSEITNLSKQDLYKLMDYHLIKVSEVATVPQEALNIGILLGLPNDFIESLKKYY